MKSLRESFEENYEPVEVPCSNRRGFRIRYEYIGPWYQWGEDAVRRKREKGRLEMPARSVCCCFWRDLPGIWL